MTMFDRFTDYASRAVVLADKQAEQDGATHTGTEHLLLGLLSQGGTVATRALNHLNVDIGNATPAVHQLPGRAPRDPRRGGHLPTELFSPRLKRVFELAVRESLMHGKNYIGPEHLLLALCKLGEGRAVEVLKSLQVTPDQLTAAVKAILGGQEMLATDDDPAAPPRYEIPDTRRADAVVTEILMRLDAIERKLGITR